MSRTEWIGVIVVLLIALAIGAVFLLPVLDDDSDCLRSTSFYDSEEDISWSVNSRQQFEYRSLSSDAQRVFDRAREDGRYTFTDASKGPSEFLYSDVSTTYAITYRNQTDYLITTGCDPNQA